MDEPVRKLGPYTLIKKIGRGAFGVVWLAEKQTAIATTRVALKLPRDEDIDIEAFKQEAAIWVEASGHPNVLPLIDADIYDGQVVIVSEYVSDGSLAGWLKQHGGHASSLEAACEIIEGVLAGLAHLHERRIIHRDLKPDNILLQRDTPRVTDFGIARVLRTSSYSSDVSGTLAYMAPEAFNGKRNEQTDIWAVGVIFYQLLAGRLPYDQPDMVSFIGALMQNDPPPLEETVPEVFRRVVMKALERDPANRYSSAVEMRRELRDAERTFWVQEGARADKKDRTKGKSAAEPESADDEQTRQFSRDAEETESQQTRAAPAPPPPEKTIKAVFDQPFTPRKPVATATPKRSKRRWLVVAAGVVVTALVIAAPFWIRERIKANEARVAQLQREREGVKAFEAEYKNVLVAIPTGSFVMGSGNGYANEKPVHQVTFTKPFYVGKYEVTEAEWQEVMGSNPSQFKGDDLPVDHVSWNDAQEFIKKLNQVDDGYLYRLPTEAEWEYACRAGTTGDYAGNLDAMAWYGDNAGRQRIDSAAMWKGLENVFNRIEANGNQPHKVGMKLPNKFGLFDMHGNVWEWCEDAYHDSYAGAPTDGSAWVDGGEEKERILRGGSWSYDASLVRSATRFHTSPLTIYSYPSLGFRLVAVARDGRE